MFGPWQMSAWAVQFVLESTGAWFAWRRRLNVLFAYLVFSAATDLLNFGIFKLFGGDAYGIAAWTQEGIQFVLLCALAVQIAAKMTAGWWDGTEDNSIAALYTYPGLLSLIMAAILTAIVRNEPGWVAKFLDAELAASCYLCIAIIVAWIGSKKGLEGIWRLVLAGLMVACVGNALLSALSTKWPLGLSLYPIPAILALLIWNLSVLPIRLPLYWRRDADLPLGKNNQLPVEILEGIQ